MYNLGLKNNLKLPIIAGIGATVTMTLLAYLELLIPNALILMAPFGATAVLVFGISDSPLAQPKNVILGHMITAIIGLLFIQYFSVTPLTLGIATGLGVTTMLLSKTTHPPAGANPLLIMLAGSDFGWSFLITPVLVGSIVIVLMGKVVQKFKKAAV